MRKLQLLLTRTITRQSFSFTSLTPSRHLYSNKWAVPTILEQPSVRRRLAEFQSNLFNFPKTRLQPLFSPGSWSNVRNFFGFSVVFGSVSFWPSVAYALNGHGELLDDCDVDFLSLETDEDRLAILAFARKFWLPAFLFLTVLLNWDSPIMLATKVILFLFSTKPSPLSVYVYVEQLCNQFVRQQPLWKLRKSLYANKVEVQDYKLLCLATVEVRDQKFVLVGILGSWWSLPFSLWEKTYSVLRAH